MTKENEIPNTYQTMMEKLHTAEEEDFSPDFPKIGTDEVREANRILQKYKEGKANLEKRIVENEQWYKLRHWDCMEDGEDSVKPVSAWLFNCIMNKHADAMDHYPMPNILPREENDREEAKMLSSILPVILDQCEFEETYSAVQNSKLKSGTGIYGCFWDPAKLGGLGDISVTKVDITNLFWEPGITDIQKSRNLFHVELCDNDILLADYPDLKDKLGGSTMDITKYIYDDSVDTSEKSPVVDWYYKKKEGGRIVLHYVKYVGETVLYATENEVEPFYDMRTGMPTGKSIAETGWYAHGLYPFIFDTLFSVEGTPAGFGFIDVGKDAQAYIDRGNQAIMKNMLANCKPRHFIRSDGSVNEEEYADTTKDFIHVDGNLGRDSILPVEGKPLSDIYVAIVNGKIDELKETTGNRDVTAGGTTGGVTAASAIAAMQEAAGKGSRDINKASYRAFRKLCLMIVELVRQFYDYPRCFRITGDDGKEQFIRYQNDGMQAIKQGTELGIDLGYRVPLFDIEITAQKQSPYSKMSQNELALNFFERGFFNPAMANQALACLDMMDFDRKQFVVEKIRENSMEYQENLQLNEDVKMLSDLLHKKRDGKMDRLPYAESAVTENARLHMAEIDDPS